MKLEKITLENFRSYSERTFEFSEGVTTIIGQNGVGKTNILEAIYTLLNGKSFRDSDEELIRHDESWWRVCGEVDGDERELRYQQGQTPPKQLLINGTNKGRYTYRQQLPVVLFEPNDLLMVHGSPTMRRTYFDELLLVLNPAVYRPVLSRYERALLQRNSLLKKNLPLSVLRDAVFVWDIALSEYGAEIQRSRAGLIYDLNKTISQVYSTIAGKEQAVELQYEPKNFGDNQKLATTLAHNLVYDATRGFTSEGPHREDVKFFLGGKDMKQAASRGEVRTFVLALKQLEVDMTVSKMNKKPIVLLDDVFSELDESRQTGVINRMECQTIMTSTRLPQKSSATTVIHLEK